MRLATKEAPFMRPALIRIAPLGSGAFVTQQDGSVLVPMTPDQVAEGVQYRFVIDKQVDVPIRLEVEIDGRDMGAVTMEDSNVRWGVSLERMPSMQGVFTFYQARSERGVAAGSVFIAPSDLGLVRVRVTVERQRVEERYCEESAVLGGEPPLMKGMPTEYAGVSGQSGVSSQQFGRGRAIDWDTASADTFTFRLVAVVGTQHAPLMSMPRIRKI